MSGKAHGTTQRFQVTVPVADLRKTPGGARVRQLLMGAIVTASGQRDGAYMVEAEQDGYAGFIDPALLAPARPATHKVATLATHLYKRPDLKSEDVVSLSFGTLLTLTDRDGAFFRTQDGLFVPAVHVAKAHLRYRDPVAVADLFLGTPYLWGGNSRLGLDCSGLVQTALLACGVACPGDSGDQERVLGKALAPRTAPQRGDLMFWRGHVALVVDPDLLIHANAHHMAVALEPVTDAIARIAEQGDGAVTSHRRL
ncbi:C40 family peptidase [Pseudoruegeria sp. SK021]|uniref:C40 family peptidase n=1 Tax=Pseudoruegeria sp. SK021 TaxID=1933035 RepID=UPI000A255962|nr:C40 family peptidase [Pseudoruegeria sp. SK021]OSP56793.1 NLP/P60 hydrolase [Pseudoruegeria sp. SK021]